MKTRLMGFAVAAALFAAPTIRSNAEDAAPAAAPSANPATTPAATPNAAPVSVPRPSIVPKATEPLKPVATDDDTPRRHRRYARRNGRYAYWQPFPVYWPHLYRSHIYWNRISWFGF